MPLQELNSIYETKIKQVPLDFFNTFTEPKPEIRKVKKVKKPKKTDHSLSSCPFCEKTLQSPTTIIEWTYCLYCGMKLK